MDMWIAGLVGALAGAHTSTWGMFKDCPHEGFAWPKYLRSTLVSAVLALVWQAVVALPLASSAGARVILFGLVYVTERGLIELYKGYLREEDQSKYFIPMQFHVMGRVVHSRAVRWSVAAGWVVVILGVVWGLTALERTHGRPADRGSARGERGRLALRFRRSLQGCAHRGLRDLEVLSEPDPGTPLVAGHGLLHEGGPLRRPLWSRLHRGHHRDLQDLLLPRQAAGEVRGQAHPFP